VQSGALVTLDGAATASSASNATASQGQALPYDGLRLRFRFRHTSEDRNLEVAVNAAMDGSGGLRVAVDTGTGELAISEAGTPLAAMSAGELATETDYYVELDSAGSELVAVLSTENYASVPGAVELVRVDVASFDADPQESFVAIELSGAGIGLDAVNVARCGEVAPTYTPLFLDTFTRPNSAVPGNAELPAASAWMGDTAESAIAGSALVFDDGGSLTADQGRSYEHDGLRIRSTVEFGPLGWFIVFYNNDPGGRGFDIWRQSDTMTFLEFSSVGGQSFPLALTLGASYYIQIDVFASTGVLTLRESSYDGAILAALATDALGDTEPDATQLRLGNTWSPAELTIDELRVDQYSP
jgi:hypothetical protein